MMTSNLMLDATHLSVGSALLRFFLLAGSLLCVADPAFGIDPFLDRGDRGPLADELMNEPDFNFGDNCARLADMSDFTLMRLIQPRQRANWTRFCRNGHWTDCDEFSYLLEGLGFLEASPEESGMCRFEPFEEMREWVPNVYRNFGAPGGAHESGEDVSFMELNYLDVLSALDLFGVHLPAGRLNALKGPTEICMFCRKS